MRDCASTRPILVATKNDEIGAVVWPVIDVDFVNCEKPEKGEISGPSEAGAAY